MNQSAKSFLISRFFDWIHLPIEAHLQVRAAFMPGHVAASHVEHVARHLTDAIAKLSTKVGLTSDYVGQLTSLLGETRAMGWDIIGLNIRSKSSRSSRSR